jgi:hypothetical protein
MDDNRNRRILGRRLPGRFGQRPGRGTLAPPVATTAGFSDQDRLLPSGVETIRSLFSVIIGAGTAWVTPLPAAPTAPAALRVLVPNGGWCWFQDERAILAGDTVVFGSVKSPSGDIDAHAWHPRSGRVESFTLAPKHESDDHDAPAFLALPDGSILASWANHGGAQPKELNKHLWWRRTTAPGDIRAWTPTESAVLPSSVSYTNLFRLPAERGRIYNFNRSVGFNPNYLVSDDDGRTFRYGGRLLAWPHPAKTDPKSSGQTGGGRPYVKYASNGRDTIHVLTTEDHPRAYFNGIFHGFIRGGTLHGSDGQAVAPLSQTAETSVRPDQLTPVYLGDAEHVAWTVDLHLDARERPVVIFSVQVNGAATQHLKSATGMDLRYFYARFDGTRWHVHPLARAGTELYGVESDYSGLAAIVPHRPERVFISTNADPVSGRPLVSATDGRRHHEIFSGLTADGGATWVWTPVTRDSTADNLRPIVPIGDRFGTVVMWLRGTMRTYRDYTFEVVGYVEPR